MTPRCSMLRSVRSSHDIVGLRSTMSYSAYDEHPLSEADEWGDLESFRAAAAAS
jgi:hypothetical protein